MSDYRVRDVRRPGSVAPFGLDWPWPTWPSCGVIALLILIIVAALTGPLDPCTRTRVWTPPLEARHAADIEADRTDMREACEY